MAIPVSSMNLLADGNGTHIVRSTHRITPMRAVGAVGVSDYAFRETTTDLAALKTSCTHSKAKEGLEPSTRYSSRFLSKVQRETRYHRYSLV